MAAGRDDVHRVPAQSTSASRACRTGGSSATRTISSCSCTAPETTSRPCAKSRRRARAAWVCGCRAAKTRIVHMSDGFDFLGFRIQWKRKTGNEQVARLHLHRRPADPVGEGEDPCPDAQDVAARPRGRADPAQPDHARLGQLLPACRLQTHPQPPGPLRVVAGDPVAADPAPLEVEGRPPPVHHPRTAGGNRSRRTGSNCSTSHRYRSPGTATGATRSPTPGPAATTA